MIATIQHRSFLTHRVYYAGLVWLYVDQGYKVYYSLNRELPLSRWFVLSVDNSQLTTVSNLITNRTYAISVLAYTAFGDGPMSWPPVLVKIQQGGLYQ